MPAVWSIAVVWTVASHADRGSYARCRAHSTVESAGFEFIDENGGGPGVRLRERQP
jgi:hypothetical protein